MKQYFVIVTILLGILSCNGRGSKVESAKSFYLNNIDSVNKITALLRQSANGGSSEKANLFFEVTDLTDKSKSNSQANIIKSHFLYKNNIESIHIYNKNVCRSEQIAEYQTIAFHMRDGIILQYDNCSDYKPRFGETVIENSRVIAVSINEKWSSFYEK